MPLTDAEMLAIVEHATSRPSTKALFEIDLIADDSPETWGRVEEFLTDLSARCLLVGRSMILGDLDPAAAGLAHYLRLVREEVCGSPDADHEVAKDAAWADLSEAEKDEANRIVNLVFGDLL